MVERPEAARIALPRSPTSVGTARRFIAARTTAWSFPEPAADQLVLIGSELVTNAVLHAAGTINVDVDLDLTAVRVEVADSSDDRPAPRDGAPEDTSGRGLHLVEAMARAWGVEQERDDGKVVWFELDVPPLPTGP